MSTPYPRRVLFVSYLFPPTGGVGVHRVTKFVKYLPDWGWRSSVLTAANPSAPLQDDSLLGEIPPGTILRKAKTWEPGYRIKQAVSGGGPTGSNKPSLKSLAKSTARRFANLALQPDAQILWHPHAYRAGVKLLRAVQHDVIVATGPPFSSFLLGARLSAASGLPLVLDYRDEWDISNAYWENKRPGRWGDWIQQRQQKRVLRAATALLATTPSSTQAVADLARAAGSRARAACIYNGFDPADYPVTSSANENRVPGAPGQRFRLAFIGTLWNLNSIEPVITALLRLASEQPLLAGELELLVAGRRTAEQDALVDRLQGTPIEVVRHPFVSHAEAVALMRSADALLMINSDRPQTQRIINAKTFEYMAARRPMFVVAPRGDVWDIVRDLPGTVLNEPGDVEGITTRLELLLERHRCGLHDNDAAWDIAQFERPLLAGQLAAYLDEVCDSALQHRGQSAASITAFHADH